MTGTNTALCAQLQSLAEETWDLLGFGLARTDGREPDERFFTDHNFLHLHQAYPAQTYVQLFSGSDEALTGADVEWWIGDGQRYVRMLVQAKRLNRKGGYSDIGRLIPGTKTRQIDRLVQVCETGLRAVPRGQAFVGLTPTFVLYNGPIGELRPPRDLCQNTRRSAKQRGCVVTHATAVQTALGPASRRRRKLSRAELAGNCLPWSCLVCCPAMSGGLAERVSTALGRAVPPPKLRIRDRGNPRNDHPIVRVWEREALPFDPRARYESVEHLLEAAPPEWSPGARLLAITTALPDGD